MEAKRQISVQTADWYDVLFGAEAGADEAFAYIKSCGFTAVDYNLDQTMPNINKGDVGTFFDRSVEEIIAFYCPVKEAAEKHGITLAMAHAPFPMNCDKCPEKEPYIMEAVIKLIAVCEYLHIPNLVVHPIKNRDRNLEWQLNMQMYSKLIPAAKKHGVTICLENLFDWRNGHAIQCACTDAQEACRYIDTLNEMAGQSCFGFCYDVGHGNITSRNIYEDLKILGKRIKVLHIHENDGRMDSHCAPYTVRVGSKQGATDWDGFLRGLKEIGYEGPLNFETFAAVEYLPKQVVSVALQYISGIGQYFKSKIED